MNVLVAVAFVFALLISSQAKADQTLRASNDSGGEIVLTDRQCRNYKNLNFGYSYSKNGITSYFCWRVMDEFIHAVYDDGDVRTYPIRFFRTQGGSTTPSKTY